MHELSICQALLDEVEHVAVAHGAMRVEEIIVAIGPLSGVDPSLLSSAFEIARRDHCVGAELHLEPAALRIACITCGLESECSPKALLCAQCGGYRVKVISGDELRLLRVRLSTAKELATLAH